MSYLVLARKWRPQSFEDVIGQKHVTRTLQNALSTGRVAHAMIFAGPKGVGKTSVARILAKAINCAQGPSAKPCGTCKSCEEITRGGSIDVQEIDGASNTHVDDVRELRENILYKPIKSRYRVYIIDEVHMLSNQAFNALLKTLEEPPPHAIFVFATTEPNKIPPTIFSRCQRFDFRRIPAAEIMEHLEKICRQEKVKIGRKGLSLIAREAEGSMRDAQSLLDQVISYAGTEISEQDVLTILGVIERHWLYETSRAVIEGRPGKCLEIIESLYDHGAPLEHFYGQLIEHFRNLTIAKLEDDPSGLIDLPEEEIRDLKEQSADASLEDLHQWFDMMIRSEQDLRRSGAPRLILEMTLVKMAHLGGALSMDRLIDRIGRLEAMIRSGPAAVEGQTQDDTGSSRPSIERQQKNNQPNGRIAGQAQEVWERLLEFAGQRRPMIAAILRHGRLISVKDSMVQLGFSNSFYNEMASKPKNRKELQELCETFFGEKVRISITVLPKEELPLFSSQEAVADYTDRRDKSPSGEDLVASDPVVRKAIEIFGGRLEEVILADNQ